MKTLLLALTCLAFVPSALAQTIDTYPAFDGQGIQSFGPEGTVVTYGQILTAPAQSRLLSFTTSLAALNAASFEYRFYVSLWDDATRTTIGTPLFTSGVLNSPTTLDPAGTFVFETTTVPVDLALTPGERYMAFYTYENPDGFGSGVALMAVTANPYAGGRFLTSTGFGSALETRPWDNDFGDNYDLAFRAEFAPVPEPGALATLALGLAFARRHRRPRRV